MKHSFNETKRLQQLAGINEWKINPLASLGVSSTSIDTLGHYDNENNVFEVDLDKYNDLLKKTNNAWEFLQQTIEKAIKSKYGENTFVFWPMLGI